MKEKKYFDNKKEAGKFHMQNTNKTIVILFGTFFNKSRLYFQKKSPKLQHRYIFSRRSAKYFLPLDA